ncbi:MAG: acyl-CoA dehydrogenase family protein [Hyphomonadaceae bacterium]
MDLDHPPEDIELRGRMRAWLEENAPRERRPSDPAGANAFDRAWQRSLFDGGFAGISWPKAHGGAGLSLLQQVIWYEEVARAKAPLANAMGLALHHAGPTLIAGGSEEQKAFHLPRILKGESVWCQGFSEPGAGSDLAALVSRGEIDGDDMVVNGQKMWTSYGHFADYQELLVRTDPSSKRHHGLTWIICDMRSPGLRVDPIVNMMGERHVNMVFYDDVRIPLSNVVGEIGQGWRIAMSTLTIERTMSFLPDQIELLERVDSAIRLAERTRLSTGKLAIEDQSIARRLAQVKADALAVRALTIANLSRLSRGGAPGVEGSVLKLYVSTAYKALTEIVAEILGFDFLQYGNGRDSNRAAYDFMWSWVLTISGGSSEIQREIIADRMLGLPRAR